MPTFQKKVTSFSKARSLVFTFDLKRELDSSSFSVLVTKLFHIAGSRADPEPTFAWPSFWIAIIYP